MLLCLFSTLKLVRLSTHPTTGEIKGTTNLTILNVFLVRLGPMNEKNLVKVLIGTQVWFPSSWLITYLKHNSSLVVSWPLLLDMALHHLYMMVTDVKNEDEWRILTTKFIE